MNKPKTDFAALRQHHLTGARYERIRQAWFKRAGKEDKVQRCKSLASHHERSAKDALMGIKQK
jgi:hypothetical protein